MDQRAASGVSGHGLFYPEFSRFRLLMRWGVNLIWPGRGYISMSESY